jgi:hypothetical protein
MQEVVADAAGQLAGLTRAEIMARTRLPSPGVGAAFTTCCICTVVMSWQVTPPMTRDGEPLAQPPLGMRVLARPPLTDGKAIGV